MLVNTEWSMFGGKDLPVTKYDRIVDQKSAMPGFQPFEQMVSGRYIGEIVRLVCMDGIMWDAWSFDTVPEKWNTTWAIQTATCSMVEAYALVSVWSNRRSNNTSEIIALLKDKYPVSSGYTPADATLFKQICIAVSTRSASLVAASTIALLQVNNELTKCPMPDSRGWCGSTSSGTPSPSDSGLGSMDEEFRWSRRGSIFSVQGSRRGSLASPTILSVPHKAMESPDSLISMTSIIQNGAVMEEPIEMILDDKDDDDDDDDDVVVVAFCGSVMEKYHAYRTRCQRILDDLVQQPQVSTSCCGSNGIEGRLRKVVEEKRRVVLEENCDGGILGAGILTAVMDTKELSFHH